jgi:hypothetical protein
MALGGRARGRFEAGRRVRAVGRAAGAGLLLLASAAAAGGCGGKSETKGGGAANWGASTALPVAAEDFTASFTNAFCKIGPCCEREGYPFTPLTCETAMKAYLDSVVNREVADSSVVFDAVAAGACIEAFRKDVTSCTDSALDAATVTACEGVFRGTIPEGGACTEDAACAEVSGAAYVYCDYGICARGGDGTPAHAQAGEPCNETCESEDNGFGCSGGGGAGSGPPAGAGACFKNDGLYCTSAYVCAPLPQRGESCRGGYVCTDDSYCDGATCVARTATGPCPTYDACLSTSHCDSSTRLCQPLKDNGAPCAEGSECASLRCDDGLCHEFTVANANECAGTFGG